MYRLLERSPASPKKSRHPARVTAKDAALKKGFTSRGSLKNVRRRETPYTSNLGGQCPEQDSKTPLRQEWRFVRLGGFRALTWYQYPRYHQSSLASPCASL